MAMKGVFITDGNAASQASEIFPAEKAGKILPSILKNAGREYWTESSGAKRRIMAECLVPERIPPELVDAVYVASRQTAEDLKSKIGTRVPVIAEPSMFFQPSMKVDITSNLSVVEGDLFFSRLQTLTVSVNCVGVMGKGLASRAKYQFPDVYVSYQDLCRAKILRMGVPYLYKRESSFDHELADEPASMVNANGATWFLLFPTKNHWRENADFGGIEKGLNHVVESWATWGLKSLAMPALGCGLGRLEWKDVGPLMCRYLSRLDIPVWIYLPAEKKIPGDQLEPSFLLGK